MLGSVFEGDDVTMTTTVRIVRTYEHYVSSALGGRLGVVWFDAIEVFSHQIMLVEHGTIA